MDEDFSSDEEEISQLEQLQFMLMNINSDFLFETKCFIQSHFSDTSEKCRQLAYQLLLPVKFHSKSFSLIIQLILNLLDSSSINDSLYELPKFLLSAISQEITSDNIIPYQNSIQAFLYQCYEAHIFDINDIISILKVCHDNFSLFNESICSLFCWFAPEIEDSDISFFSDCFESFHFHLQYTEEKSVYKIILNNFEQLRENNWFLFKQSRESYESTDPIYQAIRTDDVDRLQTLIFNTHSGSQSYEYDIDKEFEIPPFEPSWMLRFKPTGMQIAAFFGSIRCFKFYILHNANPQKRAGSIGCFGGSDGFDGMPLTYFSIAGGNAEIIHLTEQIGCNFYSDVLFSSIIFHRYQIFEWLIDTKQCDYHVCDLNGDSIYHLAVLTDNLKVLKFLREKEELVNEVDEFKMSLIHYAAKYGSFAVLDFMLNEPNIITKSDNDDDNATFLTDEENQKKSDKNQFDANAKDNEMMTPLHYAVKYRRYEAVAILLAHQKINVNAKNLNGWTPLHFAVGSQNVEIVKLLLEKKGIDPNIKNKSLVSPSLMATQMHLDEIKKLFIQHSTLRPQTTPGMLRKRPLTGFSNNNTNDGYYNSRNHQKENSRISYDINNRRPCTVSSICSDRRIRPSTTMRSTYQRDSNGIQVGRISKSVSNDINMNENIRRPKEVVVRFELQKRNEKPKLRFPIQQQQNHLQNLKYGNEKRISRTAAGSRKQITKFSTTPNLP